MRPGDRVAVAARSLPGSRWRRMAPPALVAGTLAAATIALHVRDPHAEGSWGACPTKAFFGIDCPGCGGLRAVNDLTNLQLVDAGSSNLLFVASLPVIAYVFARWSIGRWTGRSWDPSHQSLTVWSVLLVVVMIAFTILRNMPAGSWLAP
ncbi:DUF2752 domain-containing protein [Nocardioides antri]|uniref:DUF2752 domain-containing protein n=2 Tax=Nocardioides antri TaxID=2607659 RepID=A0A5B1MA45_9ACTN|nr:DUF2752 domain-containing protein [Nocardioides antri]